MVKPNADKLEAKQGSKPESKDDPPADLPPHQPRQHPRPQLQERGYHHHALRHDGTE